MAPRLLALPCARKPPDIGRKYRDLLRRCVQGFVLTSLQTSILGSFSPLKMSNARVLRNMGVPRCLKRKQYFFRCDYPNHTEVMSPWRNPFAALDDELPWKSGFVVNMIGELHVMSSQDVDKQLLPGSSGPSFRVQDYKLICLQVRYLHAYSLSWPEVLLRMSVLPEEVCLS
jgi:hypothetical protein